VPSDKTGPSATYQPCPPPLHLSSHPHSSIPWQQRSKQKLPLARSGTLVCLGRVLMLMVLMIWDSGGGGGACCGRVGVGRVGCTRSRSAARHLLPPINPAAPLPHKLAPTHQHPPGGEGGGAVDNTDRPKDEEGVWGGYDHTPLFLMRGGDDGIRGGGGWVGFRGSNATWH